ncbi:MAG: HEAT repeat domain-containing protein [Methanoregula sp.]|jgi:HEAT repeat protein|uniref:HEAT repeat domain-containing protein n=1 Tax=Methanoregula sp. TaxID=2052170 RepID=UPI003D0C15F7
MNDSARTTLKRLVGRYGISVAHDANRCEGLLRDTCPQCSREIFVLTNAVRQHVTDDLLAPRHTLPLSLTEGFLAKRLEDELGFSGEVARWAVISWAEALGLADPAQSTATPKKPAAPEPTVKSTTPTNPALREQWAADLCNAPRQVRLGIVANLAGAPDPGNLRLLIGALENDDWTVRSAAFDALSDPETCSAPFLIDALHNTPDGITWRVALILGTLQALDAIDALIPLLDRSPVARDAAIWALGEIGSRGAATPLMKLLHHPDTGVVFAAEDALKKIG